ncbi:MAG: NAD(P)/FAD-dependent oxidoreductase, partial [Kangiellaceae bacterium]
SAAKQFYNEVCEGVATVNHLIQKGIDCDAQSKGYLRVAHKPSMIKPLQEQTKFLESLFDYQTTFLDSKTIRQQYFDSSHAYGAIKFNDGYGINPLKLAWGYARLAAEAGVKIYTASPVEQIVALNSPSAALSSDTDKHNYQLVTPSGLVKANKVIIATNGYTPFELHSSLNKRMLPVLSQIIVTRPLTKDELTQCNFLTDNVVMDTRALKYYFRKLPDNRILFGGRGAINGKDAEDPYYANRLLGILKNSFPGLNQSGSNSINIEYAWSGWISMALDDIPHIVKGDEQGNLFYSAGYCGNGVSFSVQAGKRLAEMVAGIAVPKIPIYTQRLPKFPFSPLRRVGQWGYFQYGKVKDRWL